MDDTLLNLSNTRLKTRTLWFDGDSSYPPKAIHTALLSGHKVFVEALDSDIEQYNKLVSPRERVSVKTDIRPLEFNWKIPDEFRRLDLTEYLVNRLDSENWKDESELKKRAVRVVKELKLYEHHGLLDVLRVLIYVINTLSSNSVVWGVGRGSSVSSYVLYLIGVHDVDSVKYELNIEDFLH